MSALFYASFWLWIAYSAALFCFDQGSEWNRTSTGSLSRANLKALVNLLPRNIHGMPFQLD